MGTKQNYTQNKIIQNYTWAHILKIIHVEEM